jgi:carboxyl-terminal processing protease
MNSAWRTLTTIMLTAFVAVAVFAGGFVAGHFTALPNSPLFVLAGAGNLNGEQAGPESRDAIFAPFWEAWDLVHQQYVDQPVDDVALMRGALQGMMEALQDDPTRYMAPEEYSIITSDQSGELQGIGAYVEGVEGVGLRIISPFPGSPAEAAGLLPGDIVIQVDDTDVTHMTEYEAIALVRGAAGSAVRLTIQREGTPEPVEYTVTRAKIVIPSIESELLEGQVGYVKINDFGARRHPQGAGRSPARAHAAGRRGADRGLARQPRRLPQHRHRRSLAIPAARHPGDARTVRRWA